MLLGSIWEFAAQLRMDYKSFVNVKLSKTQLSKITQSGGLLGKLLWQLMKVRLSLMKNVLTSLAKKVQAPLGLIAAGADVVIHKKTLGSGASGTSNSGTTTLTISNKDMKESSK